MTYAAFDHAMMYFWFVWFAVLVVGLVWAAWVLLWDHPRQRNRVLNRLYAATKAAPPRRDP